MRNLSVSVRSRKKISVSTTIPGWLIVVSFAVLTLGTRNNVLEKGVFLIAALTCLILRESDRIDLYLFGISSILVVCLAIATSNHQFSWSIFIFAWFSQLALAYVLLAYRPTLNDAKAIINGISVLPLLSVAIGVTYSVAGIHPLWEREFSSGVYRFQASMIPAYLSGLSMCASFTALHLLLNRPNAIKGFIFLVNLCILLLAGGRMALIVTIISCTASLFFSPQLGPARKFYASLGALVVVFVGLMVFGRRIITRFGGSGSNGRELMWQYLYGLADRHPWAGIGFGHQYFSVPEEIKLITGSSAAHNDFIRLLVELGYCGMPIFYSLLSLSVFVVAWRAGKFWPSPIVIVGYIGVLLLSFSDNVLGYPTYFFFVILATAATTYSRPPIVALRSQCWKYRLSRRLSSERTGSNA